MVFKAIIGGIIITFVAIVLFKTVDPKFNNNGDNNNLTQGGNGIISSDKSNTFSITGEVARAGSYVLEEGATMSELIDAAGGVNATADERCYYLEATLVVKETYYIPAKFKVDDLCGNEPIDKVNINTAAKEELDEGIPGVGSTLAEAIINYRNENGTFYTLESLKNISGIKNSTFAKLKDSIKLKD